MSRYDVPYSGDVATFLAYGLRPILRNPIRRRLGLQAELVHDHLDNGVTALRYGLKGFYQSANPLFALFPPDFKVMETQRFLFVEHMPHSVFHLRLFFDDHSESESRHSTRD